MSPLLPSRLEGIIQILRGNRAHFEGLKTALEAGFWKMGGTYAEKWGKTRADLLKGALLDEVPDEGASLKIQGSAMVALASSKEEVIEQLKNDIYAKSDVWDLSKASSRMIWNVDWANFQVDSNLSIQVCFPSSMISCTGRW